MTIDDYTTAVIAAAERRLRPPGISGQTLPSIEQVIECDGYRRGFVEGAEWARGYLAAQEASEAEVEAAARVWAESGPTAAVWEQMSEDRREYTRERMRACLSAVARVRRDGA